jgi:uncharacterized iron-regulated protein
MKKLIKILAISIFLTGCNTYDYSAYVDGQVRISRDNVIKESSQMHALLELSKHPDPTVRAFALVQLQKLHESGRIVIQPPK